MHKKLVGRAALEPATSGLRVVSPLAGNQRKLAGVSRPAIFTSPPTGPPPPCSGEGLVMLGHRHSLSPPLPHLGSDKDQPK